MFREMRRFKQQVSDEECKQILTEEKRAALSVIGEDGYPYAIPVNFYYDENENRIYLHGAKTGHKIDAIKACDKVCLTTWNQGFKKDGRWEWNATSVVVFGRATLLDGMDGDEVSKKLQIEKLRKLAEKYYPNQAEVDEEMASSAVSRAQMIAIDIDHMTGKLVNER